MTAAPQSIQPTTASERDQIVARLSDLQAKQEAATGWGAAVGAREEEIRSLESRLLRIDSMTAGNQPSSSASDGLWLIVKRGLYFRPDCKGYTGIKDEAGRYKLDFAKGYDRGECKIVREEDGPEFMPAAYNDLVIQHLTKQRDEARAELARVRDAAQPSPDQRLTEDMTLAHNARKAAIEECARVATRAARRCVRERLPGDSVAAYIEREILALSAVTPSPGPRAWTPDQFWEYVGAMAGEFEAGQMRDMLAAKGLSITSTPRATPAVERCPTCNETDASHRYEPPFRRCNDPWHTDDHLRAKALRMPPAQSNSEAR